MRSALSVWFVSCIVCCVVGVVGCESLREGTEDEARSAGVSGALPVIPPPPAFQPPVPETFALLNGLQVWLLKTPTTPLVSLRLAIAAGSADDPKGREGLASLTANMLDEGAGKRDALQLAADVDQIGATLGIGVDRDQTTIALQALRRNFEKILDILADVATRPTFPESEWSRVHDMTLTGVKQRGDDPTSVAQVVAERVFYGDAHPYGHPSGGYEKSVQAIQLADVKRFYADHYRSDRALLLVAGNFTSSELRQLVEPRFGSWQTGAKQQTSPGSVSPRPGWVIVDKPQAEQTVIRILVPIQQPTALSARLAHAVSLNVSNLFFGGSFTSRLNQNLREKHKFTYGAGSRVPLRRGPSYLVASSSVRAQETGPALREFCREFRDMEAGNFKDDELLKSKASMRGRLLGALQNQQRSVQLYDRSVLWGLGPTGLRDYFGGFQNVSLDAAKKIATTHYTWDKATVVLVGDRTLLETELQKLRDNLPEVGGRKMTMMKPRLYDREGAPVN